MMIIIIILEVKLCGKIVGFAIYSEALAYSYSISHSNLGHVIQFDEYTCDMIFSIGVNFHIFP